MRLELADAKGNRVDAFYHIRNLARVSLCIKVRQITRYILTRYDSLYAVSAIALKHIQLVLL